MLNDVLLAALLILAPPSALEKPRPPAALAERAPLSEAVLRQIRRVLDAPDYEARSRALELLMIQEELWRGSRPTTRAEIVATGRSLEAAFPEAAEQLRDAFHLLLLVHQLTADLAEARATVEAAPVGSATATRERVMEILYAATTHPTQRERMVAAFSGASAFLALVSGRPKAPLSKELAERFVLGCRACIQEMLAQADPQVAAERRDFAMQTQAWVDERGAEHDAGAARS